MSERPNVEVDALVRAIAEHGYVVVSDVLDGPLCDELVEACRRAHARFSPDYAPAESTATVHGTGNVALVHNLHNKHHLFRDLIFHPIVNQVAEAVLSAGSYQEKEPFQLALAQARGLTGPHPAQQLHIDSYLPGLPYTLVLQAAWVLSDFTSESGATCIVPGSHRLRRFAGTGVEYDTEIIEAHRGDLILFDGGLWHGSSRKTTNDERWAIFNRYSRWFMRPSFDLMRNTPRSIYESLNDRERQILGFRFDPPIDEFTRVTRMRDRPGPPNDYSFPGANETFD